MSAAATDLGQVHLYIGNGPTLAQLVVSVIVSVIAVIWMLSLVGKETGTAMPQLIAAGVVLVGIWWIWPVINPPRTCAEPIGTTGVNLCGPPVLDDGRLIILEGDHRYSPGAVTSEVVNISNAHLAEQGALTGAIEDWGDW